MYHVSAQGVDERMIIVHYYYYLPKEISALAGLVLAGLFAPQCHLNIDSCIWGSRFLAASGGRESRKGEVKGESERKETPRTLSVYVCGCGVRGTYTRLSLCNYYF